MEMKNRSSTFDVEQPKESDTCQHEYILCENVFPLAICCIKCGHMLVKNPDGIVAEGYTPIRL